MKNGLLSLGSIILGLAGILLFTKFAPHFKGYIIILFVLIITTAIVATHFMIKQLDVVNDKEEKIRKQRIQKLESKYADYVKVVDETIQNMITNVEKKVPVTIFKEPMGHHYLILFEKYLDWICKNRIIGKPDTFVMSSCLMYSLMHRKMIVTNDTKNYNEKTEELLLTINCQLAFDVALEIISKPITFDKDEKGEYIISKYHPKKDIVVPEGLIQDNHLYNRILRNIVKDYIANSDSCHIMQFANLLQLIYLNCK